MQLDELPSVHPMHNKVKLLPTLQQNRMELPFIIFCFFWVPVCISTDYLPPFYQSLATLSCFTYNQQCVKPSFVLQALLLSLLQSFKNILDLNCKRSSWLSYNIILYTTFAALCSSTPLSMWSNLDIRYSLFLSLRPLSKHIVHS